MNCKVTNYIGLHLVLYNCTGGGLTQFAASMIESTKLINTRPG